MNRFLISALSLFMLGYFAIAAEPAKSTDKSLPAELTEKGLTASSSNLILAEEREFRDKLKDLKPLLRQLLGAEKERQAVEASSDRRKSQKTEMKQQHRRLMQMLNEVPEGDVDEHNRIVKEINRLQSFLASDDSEEDNPAANRVRGESQKSRTRYVQGIRELQEMVAAIEKKYAEMKEDETVTETLAKYNESAEKPLALGASRGFSNDVKELTRLAEKIKSESITLRKRGGVHLVDVLLNDTASAEFVLDTGASLLCLPYTLAQKAGLSPSESDQNIQLKIANGNIINGKLMTLASVRVGDFEVKGVECAVLDEAYPDVEPLLGNSFLGKFNHHIDPEGPALELTGMGEDETQKPAPTSRKRRRTSKED